MSKLFAIFNNELEKMIRRRSTIILVILMVLCIILPMSLRYLSKPYEFRVEPRTAPTAVELANEKEELNKKSGYLLDEKGDIKAAAVKEPGDRESARAELDERKEALAKEDLLLSLGERFNKAGKSIHWGESGFIYGKISSLIHEKGATSALILNREKRQRLFDAAERGTKAFFTVYRDLLQELPVTDSAEKIHLAHRSDMINRILTLTDKNPSEIDYDYIDKTLSQMELLATSIEIGCMQAPYSKDHDESYQAGMLITEPMRQMLQQEYTRLENSLSDPKLQATERQSRIWHLFTTGTDIGYLFLGIIMIIFAGGLISGELATGTIKALIIAPVKRWKIYVAKTAALVIFGLLLALLVAVVAYLTLLLLLGNVDVCWSYFVGSTIKVMTLGKFIWLYALTNYFDILCMMAFAQMLSSFTKNTAVAVGITVAGYLGGKIVGFMLLPLRTSIWLSLIPYAHMNLTYRLLPLAAEGVDMYRLYSLMLYKPTLLGTAVYLVLAFAAIFYIGFDSFTRRDIK
ncbi:hypothetical protein HMPREF0868_1391 [Mageeibacillus indolicus UPII9-5]|uniref:ABC transporter permease n=1 Tax=Mageeibacillus indolicus (strain UPII9-5) TaxID=699246 RepID=D3QYW5_MAGIU|nr:ABC transporter permease subunit [Mageeibacillus indolicus]ADC90680.1 hypothetical protein HMPREF0868_1391 [Mageeibacillus indolicus UPII9-5]